MSAASEGNPSFPISPHGGRLRDIENRFENTIIICSMIIIVIMMIDDHPQHYDDHYRPLHHDHHCSQRDDQFSFDLWKNLSGPLNPPTL